MGRLLAVVWLNLLLPVMAFANVTQCPGTVLEGIDISVWQGNINWGQVKASGKYYASIRVGDGYYLDTKFSQNWAGAKNAGVIRSAYQFFEPGEDPITQADILINKVGGKLDADDLPPMIDVEATGGQSPGVIADRIGKWVGRIKEKLGRDAIVYTGKYFWDDNVKSWAFNSLPLWHAQYCNCCPTIAAPWNHWTFWQYTSSGKVGGIAGNVDLDKYNGTLGQMQAWISGQSGCSPHCSGTKVVDSKCNVSDCAPSGANCVEDSLGVRCVSIYCPALGSTKVCLPSPGNGAIADCNNGDLSGKGDCNAYAAYCSTALGGAAKCVSEFCVDSAQQVPGAKNVCLPDGIRYACNAAGDISAYPCPTGSSCKSQGGSAICSSVIVGIAETPDTYGWWSVRGTGAIDAHGTALTYGDLSGTTIATPAIAVAASPAGLGYWIALADGTVTAFGDAAVLGPASGQSLASPIVDMTRAGDTQGIWLVAADGTVYSLGAAPKLASISLSPGQSAVAIDSTSSGQGYWIATNTGDVKAIGDATAVSPSLPSPLPGAVRAMARSSAGKGFWIAGVDGQVYAAGDAKAGDWPKSISAPIVGIARHAYGAGYWLIGEDGAIYDFPTACVAQCIASGLVKEDCSIHSCSKIEANCVDDAIGARCVSVYCPAVGSEEVCLPDVNGFLHGTCTDGALAEDKCIPGVQWCSTVGAAKGKCVSVYCANFPDDPSIDHDLCMGDGTRWHCAAETGQPTPLPCPDGTQCQPAANAICVNNPVADAGGATDEDAGGGAMGGGYGDADAEVAEAVEDAQAPATDAEAQADAESPPDAPEDAAGTDALAADADAPADVAAADVPFAVDAGTDAAAADAAVAEPVADVAAAPDVVAAPDAAPEVADVPAAADAASGGEVADAAAAEVSVDVSDGWTVADVAVVDAERDAPPDVLPASADSDAADALAADAGSAVNAPDSGPVDAPGDSPPVASSSGCQGARAANASSLFLLLLAAFAVYRRSAART